MNMQSLTPVLPLSVIRFNFTVSAPVQLPHYPGSAWRGAFGEAFKKTVCVVDHVPCGECSLKRSCAYSYVFETPPPEGAQKMRKYRAAPHPFVLQLHDASGLSDGHYSIGMILFGHGHRFFPYIAYAMQRAGSLGIGGKRQVFTLANIEQCMLDASTHPVYQQNKLHPLNSGELPRLPPMPQQVKIAIHTPMRIKQNGKHLDHAHFNFAAFFGSLLRRISMLTYFHTDTPLETDFAALMQQARQIEFNAKQLSWYDWTRYSSRQQCEMHMGGVIGTLALDLQGLEALWPYLWLGQWVHAGKATSMGMGQYSIAAASLPSF